MSATSFLHNIENQDSVVFPAPGPNEVDLREISQSILDRYYSAFIKRLQCAGYSFPPRNRYNTQFDQFISSTLVVSRDNGSIYDPGPEYRCLVFVFAGKELDAVILGRSTVHRGNYLAVFGDAPQGVDIHIENDVRVTVVAVRSEDARRIQGGGVYRI